MVKRSFRRSRTQTLKRKAIKINWKTVIAVILVTGIAWISWVYLQSRTNQAHLFQTLQTKQTELNAKLQELDKSKGISKDLEKQKEDLQKQKQDLENQLQAKRAAQEADRVYAASLPAVVPKAAVAAPKVATGGCVDAKSCIYFHESGNNPGAVNSIGCYGLGQDCNGIVRNRCGADYACQDEYFTDYAIRRYGSWTASWQFWQQHSWW